MNEVSVALDFAGSVVPTSFRVDNSVMKANTCNLGGPAWINYRRKAHPVYTLDDLLSLKCSVKVAREVLEPCGYEVREDDTVMRIDSHRRQKGYFGWTMRKVTIADPDFSPEFVITDSGEQLKRSTLFWLPKQCRIAEIFMSRNTRC